MRMSMLARMAVLAGGLLSGMNCRADIAVLLTRNGTETLWGRYAPLEAISDLPVIDDSYTKVRVYGGAGDQIGVITLTGTRPAGSVLDVLVVGAGMTEMPESSQTLPRAGMAW